LKSKKVSLKQLKEQLTQNITQDKEIKEKNRVETAAIEAIVKQATIGEIPEKLIANEVHKMSHELEHGVARQGMDMAGYLKSINKTMDDLKKDFHPQAEERVKAALVMRQIAQEEKIQVDDKQIDEEVKKQLDIYKDNKEAVKNIIQEGDLILVKGSQSARMERAVEIIMTHPEDKENLLVRQEEEWKNR